MTTVNPYLTFNGTCEEAFNFYKSVFGGEFTYLGRYSDMPKDEDCGDVPKPDEQKIMHVSLPISKETMLMGSDTNPNFGKVDFGTNVSIAIGTDSKDHADRLFNGLSKGGKITMPMEDTFWGDYFGMFTDKFGFHWMVSFANKPKK